jgi:DNA-binding protein H-NS
MKRATLIAVLTAVMIMICQVAVFADQENGFYKVSSYPENGATNTSMENLGVKLYFSKPINSDEAKAADESKFRILDEDGKEIPVRVLFSDNNDGLVLVIADTTTSEKFMAKNNSEYTLVIDADVVDNDGNQLGSEERITFRTYNQKVNNMVNMVMMFVMFGGITFFTVRQNSKKDEEEAEKKDEPKEAAFNPYREAKRTGKSVEEVMAEQAKKEEKLAKKKARKNKGKEEAPQETKIENCAEYLNNVYHVHAPAPISKEHRSIEALRASRKAEAKAAKAAKEAQYKKK